MRVVVEDVGAAATLVGIGEEEEEEEEGLHALSASSLFSFVLSDKVFEVQSAVVFAFLPTSSLCNTARVPCTFLGTAGVGVLLLGLLNLPRGPACTFSFSGPLFLVCDFRMCCGWFLR